MTASGEPRAAHVIVGGGFAAAALDIVNAMVFWNLYAGTKPATILQSIAAGPQGKAAFAGGAASAAVPLSKASSPPFIATRFIDSLLAHVLLVGLLFAFVARWSAGRSR